jgi:putative FmdB family regulatory protein
MPTYDYRCKECGHELEAQQAFTDDPLTVCPACGASALRKKFGSVGISFKGSGFYKTDSRSGGSSGSSGSSSTSSSSTTSTS